MPKTLHLSTLVTAICALALVGFGTVASVEAATTHKAPPTHETKTIEKKSLSDVKEQAKEKMKEDAKEKVAEKLGIEQKQPTKPGMPMKK